MARCLVSFPPKVKLLSPNFSVKPLARVHERMLVGHLQCSSIFPGRRTLSSVLSCPCGGRSFDLSFSELPKPHDSGRWYSSWIYEPRRPPRLIARMSSSTCQVGYPSWSCSFHEQYFTGCCSVDACRQTPVGCPESAQPITVTPFLTSTASLTSTGQTHLSTTAVTTDTTNITTSPSADQSAPSSQIVTSSGPTSDAGPSSPNGILIPISALVVLVVGSVFFLITGAITACMRWGKHQRKRDQARKAASESVTKPLGEGQLPPDLNSSAIPHAHGGPGYIADEVGGRLTPKLVEPPFLGAGNSSRTGEPVMLGSVLPTRENTRNGGEHGILTSPATLAGTASSDLSPNLSELESTPTHREFGIVSQPNHWVIELDCLASERDSPSGQGRPGEELRATLSSTQIERDSNTYVNSWTKYGNVQT